MNGRPALGVLALLVFLAGAAAAQAPVPPPAPRSPVPPLRISAPVPMSLHAPNGTLIRFWKVLLTNDYHAPATAYAVSYVTHLPLGFSSRGSRWFDALPSVRLTPPLAPAASVSLTVPWHGGRIPVVTDRCVIYADGAVAGNLNLVGHFMSARAVFLAELHSLVARLQTIAQRPGANRATIVSEFRRQAVIEERALQIFDPKGIHPRSPARVAESVLATYTHSQRNVQDIATVLARTMTDWQVQLASSRPRLPEIAVPQVSLSVPAER